VHRFPWHPRIGAGHRMERARTTSAYEARFEGLIASSALREIGGPRCFGPSGWWIQHDNDLYGEFRRHFAARRGYEIAIVSAVKVFWLSRLRLAYFGGRPSDWSYQPTRIAHRLHAFVVDDAETGSASNPLIDRTPGVVGGSARITRTRIAVWTLESYRRLGWNDEQLLSDYPTLRQTDLDAAWIYVSRHQDEIDVEIAQNESA
jgi:uncharacterized protein (DUF433 family)